MIDHTRRESLLARSGLEWTALRPMMLDDTSGSDPARKMKPGDLLLRRVSRQALARTMVLALNDRSTIGRNFLPPFVLHGAVQIGTEEIDASAKSFLTHITDPLLDPRRRLARLLSKMKDESLGLKAGS